MNKQMNTRWHDRDDKLKKRRLLDREKWEWGGRGCYLRWYTKRLL